MLRALWLAGAVLAMCSADPGAPPDIPIPRASLATGGAVQRVVLKPDTMFLNVGDVGQGSCTVYGNNNTVLKYNCTWKSLDTTVAKISSVGTNVAGVTARKIGKTRIIATSKGKADTAWVLVTSTVSAQVKRIIVEPESISVGPGGTQQFCAFVGFASGHIALRQAETGIPECAAMYAAFGTAERAVTADEQAAANLLCIKWTAEGGTITSELCGTPS